MCVCAAELHACAFQLEHGENRALLAKAFGISTSEARRQLAQGAVRLDGEVVGGTALDLPADAVDGRVLQVGRRRFVRLGH